MNSARLGNFAGADFAGTRPSRRIFPIKFGYALLMGKCRRFVCFGIDMGSARLLISRPMMNFLALLLSLNG